MGTWPPHSELLHLQNANARLSFCTAGWFTECSRPVSLAVGLTSLPGSGHCPIASICRLGLRTLSGQGRVALPHGKCWGTDAPGAISTSVGCTLLDSYPSSLLPTVLHGSQHPPLA